jgi:hypothetical protein
MITDRPLGRSVPTVDQASTSGASRGSRRAPTWAITVMVLAGLGYCVLFVSAFSKADSDMLLGLTIAPVLLGFTIPIAFRIGRAEGDRAVAGIVIAAAAAKLVGAYARYAVASDVYGGRTDAQQYDAAGRILAPAFRSFDFSTDVGSLTSTGSIKVLTGLVYALFGTGQVLGYFVFAWFGFLGLVLFSRALKVGVPEGDSRRYLVAVLFLPSLLYWPSAIGKEGPMLLALGLMSYGIACLFQRRSNGVLPLAAGTATALMIRPHLVAIVFVGVVFAALVRKAPARTYAAPLFRVLGVAVLVLLGLFLASRTQSFLDQKLQLSDASLTEQLRETQARTTEAGSSFTPITVETPLDIPLAFVTVLFRPFPFEVSNMQGLLTAAEGSMLIALLFVSRRRLRAIPRLIRTTPYVAFSIAYLLAFVIAFSAFANFGILARQRVQALPLLLVLIALPHATARTADIAPELPRATVQPGAGLPPHGPRGRRRRQLVPVPVSAPAGTVAASGPEHAPVGGRRRRRSTGNARPRRAPVSSGSAFPPPLRAHT